MRAACAGAAGIGLAAALALAGCGGARSARSGVPPAGDGVRATTPADSSFEAAYLARQAAALERYSEADVRFMTGMIGHHAQALIMSGFAPTHGASGPVRTLAARIVNAQQDEIAIMQRWLRDRGEAVPEVHIEGRDLMVHGGAHDAMHMPGMLTAEQLRELDEARGAAFDRLFLRYMIQHHRGAVTMVEALFGADGAMQDDAIFKIASDIQVDQTTEIARMERMLETLGAPGRAR